MRSRRIKGLLFDKDGTLFDFSATWVRVIERTLDTLSSDPALRRAMADAVGYDYDEQRFRPGAPAVAGSVADVARIWSEFLPGQSPAAVEAHANALADDIISGGGLVPAVPDLPGLLAELLGQGYTLGVATHDSEAAARAQLRHIGAVQPFSFIAGYDSGHGLKPGPGMLLAFAAAVGLRPDEIAMIGDSVHDLGMVSAAGAALAVGVLTGPADHQDLAPLADHVLPSIGHLPDLLQSL